MSASLKYKRTNQFNKHLQQILNARVWNESKQTNKQSKQELEMKILFDQSLKVKMNELNRKGVVRKLQTKKFYDVYYDVDSVEEPFYLARNNVWMRKRIKDVAGLDVAGLDVYEIKVGPDLECTASGEDGADGAYISNVLESNDLAFIYNVLDLSFQSTKHANVRFTEEDMNKGDLCTVEMIKEYLDSHYKSIISFGTERDSFVSADQRFRIDLDASGSYRVGEIEALEADISIEDLRKFCDDHDIVYLQKDNPSMDSKIVLKSKIEVLAMELNRDFYNVMIERQKILEQLQQE